MASMTTNKFRELIMNGGIDLDNAADTAVKVMLVQNTYTPDRDHDFVSSITSGTTKELTGGTGYTGGFGGSGRKALTGKTIVKDNATDKAYWDATDSSWNAINSGTIGYVVVIREVTADSDSPILVIIDVPDTATNGSDLTLQWAADGICNITSP